MIIYEIQDEVLHEIEETVYQNDNGNYTPSHLNNIVGTITETLLTKNTI